MEPLQLIVDACALGAVYVLVALGFVLVLNGIGAVNLAHGDLVTLGGFSAIAAAGWAPGWPGLAFLPMIALLMGVVGACLVAVVPTRRRSHTADEIPLATFAVGVMLAAALAGVFGKAPISGPPLVGNGQVGVFGLAISRQSLLIVVTTVILVPLVHLLLNRTQFGRRLRAAGQDPELARSLGIETGRMAAATFALGTMLAGIAGVLLADRFTVSPSFGLDLLVKSYVAVAIAGWGQVGATAGVALAIALFETAVSTFAAPAVADAVVYVVLLVLLAFQPQGMFGPAAQRRA